MMSGNLALKCENDFGESLQPNFSKSLADVHIFTSESKTKIIYLQKTEVFRRHHVVNDPVNNIDPSGLVTQGLIGQYTTPAQQAAIGATLLGVAAYIIKPGVQSLNPYLIAAASLLAYEGYNNIQYAKDRGLPNPLEKFDQSKTEPNKCPDTSSFASQ